MSDYQLCIPGGGRPPDDGQMAFMRWQSTRAEILHGVLDVTPQERRRDCSETSSGLYF